MSVCFSNLLPNAEYSNLLIVSAFSNKHSSGKTSLPIKNSYLPIFLDDKAEILVVFFIYTEMSFISLRFVINCFDFLPNSHF